MFCECGCGQQTNLALYTSTKHGWVKGEPYRFLRGHHSFKFTNKGGATSPRWNGGRSDQGRGYMRVFLPDHARASKNGYVYEHLLIAERVLNKPLPPGVEVHHVNGNPSENDNHNLVICQDHAYHMLLHMRQRALRACGNPAFRKCCYCHQWDAPDNLKQYSSESAIHRDCANLRNRISRNHLTTLRI